MSQIQLKSHHLSPLQRRQIIREHILRTNYEGLAKLCGVTKRTILRDVADWRQEGGFEDCLVDEFFRFYPKAKVEFSEKAFDRLCYLIGKTMTRRMELKEEYKEEVTHKLDISVLSENEKSILDNALRVLERKSKRELNQIH